MSVTYSEGYNDDEAFKTYNIYVDSLASAYKVAKTIQSNLSKTPPTLTAEDYRKGEEVFKKLHKSSNDHASYIAESHAKVWADDGDDHVSKSDHEDFLRMSAQSQAAASAFANGSVPDLAFVLDQPNLDSDEEAEDAPAGDAPGGYSATSGGTGAGGDGTEVGSDEEEQTGPDGEVNAHNVAPDHFWL
jgi:hypothetical protein